MLNSCENELLQTVRTHSKGHRKSRQFLKGEHFWQIFQMSSTVDWFCFRVPKVQEFWTNDLHPPVLWLYLRKQLHPTGQGWSNLYPHGYCWPRLWIQPPPGPNLHGSLTLERLQIYPEMPNPWVGSKRDGAPGFFLPQTYQNEWQFKGWIAVGMANWLLTSQLVKSSPQTKKT